MCDVEENIVSGQCKTSWECIRQIFRQNFIEQLDVGATLCIYYKGQCVVDLAGGWFDNETHKKPYTHDTLQIVYSTGKGIIATALALCVQRGWLDYDERVATYWPEFGQNGKQNIKVKDLLSHRAGLPVVDDEDHILKLEDILDDPTKIVQLLVKQKPYWEPDVGGHGYHALTFPYLTNELIRRIDNLKHRSMGQFIEEELASILDGCEYFPVNRLSEEYSSRVSTSILPRVETKSTENQSATDQLQNRAFTINGLVSSLPCNDKDKHLSLVNILTNARSLARLYASLIFTENFVTADTLVKVIQNNTPENEPDQILDRIPTKFSQGGFMLDGTVVNDFGKAFGHWGLGGSIAFACPDKQLSFAYVPNKLDFDMSKTNLRIQRIFHAIRTLID
ncbi:hypothetical protein I4U23_023255 [Adineta vaga]|nr:hypothetical protein I4U23_023255 [Adineta vaga]